MKGSISKAELKIMNVLWEIGTLPLNQIVLYLEKDWKRQTILTLIARLEGKGYISHTKVGRVQFYTPLFGKEECLKEFFAEFLEDWKVELPELAALMESPGKEE